MDFLIEELQKIVNVELPLETDNRIMFGLAADVLFPEVHVHISCALCCS